MRHYDEAQDLASGQDKQGRTLVVKLGYQGLAFAGYAEQDAQRTVAGELRRALETLLRRSCEMTCAGRTDAGVHALAQYVSVPLEEGELAQTTRRCLLRSLSALTPDDIGIREVYEADPGFSARFDAQSRAYRYRLFAEASRPILCAPYAWWIRTELCDEGVEAMQEAAQHLVGEHDFKSFCKAISAEGKPTCRFVESIKVSRLQEADEPLVAVDIRGNAFLHNMVRNIVGSLVEVGRGNREPYWMAEVLAACDRCVAGPCAPAHGLTLRDVSYPEGLLRPWH